MIKVNSIVLCHDLIKDYLLIDLDFIGEGDGKPPILVPILDVYKEIL